MGVGNWFLMLENTVFFEALAAYCAVTWHHIPAEQKPQIHTKFVHFIQKVHVFPRLVLYDIVCGMLPAYHS